MLERRIRPAAIDATGLKPVSVTRLADDIVAQIRRLIIDEGIAEGERLPPERELAARLGSSRVTVSQALRTLSLMGLVEIRPGSGAYVIRNPATLVDASLNLMIDLNPESVDELAELRYWLERVGAREALDRMGPHDLDSIEHALERLGETAGQTSAWIAADTVFHAAIVRSAGNPYLAAIYESVHSAVISINYEAWVERELVPSWLLDVNFDASLALHRDMLDALRTRDRAALERATETHHAALIDHLHRRAPAADADNASDRGRADDH